MLKPGFELTVCRELRPAGPVLHVEASGAISVATAGSGMVTAAILGEAGRDQEASRLANRHLEGDGTRLSLASHGTCLVVVDHRVAQVLTVAPPISLHQVYWASRADRIGFASTPRRLSGIAESSGIDPAALYEYAYFHVLPAPSSILKGIAKLAGGHALRWEGGRPDVERYWEPRFSDAADMPESEAASELRRLLKDAVDRVLAPAGPAGAFLSGGLDSSTVAGLAAQCRPGIATVSMGFDARGYDEMAFARIAARHFATRPIEYYVTPEDVLSTLPRIAAAFPEPFGNSSAAATYQCARIAHERGLELLLAGDGGDELFGGNERYAKQLVFERYGRVPRPVRRFLLEPAIAAASRLTHAFPIGKARSYIDQANVPLPDRLQSYNFLHRHAPEEVFEGGLLSQVDLTAPLRSLRDAYRVPSTDSVINRMLFLDWKFTLEDNDLVKVNTMCALGGVDVAYPMLAGPVVDFSLRLPGSWKVRDGDLRWFYKRAFRDFLPRETITKAKHGFGLPFGFWTRTHDGLRRLSEESLGSLSTRGFFRPKFLEEAIRLHREGHASYYGELVWILMVLELWLQEHHPDARL